MQGGNEMMHALILTDYGQEHTEMVFLVSSYITKKNMERNHPYNMGRSLYLFIHVWKN